MSKHDTYRKFWIVRRKKYGDEYAHFGELVFAKAPTPGERPYRTDVPNPSKVDHLMSAVFEQGTRHYCFKNDGSREVFLRNFPGIAEACEDPMP